MVMEMKEMVGFDMGEDSCGLIKVAYRILFQGGEYVKENKRKLFSFGNRSTWSHSFYVHYMYDVSCHSFFVFHYP